MDVCLFFISSSNKVVNAPWSSVIVYSCSKILVSRKLKNSAYVSNLINEDPRTIVVSDSRS